MQYLYATWLCLKEQFKYTDTFLLELLCIWQGAFHFPNIIRHCMVQEDPIQYLYYISSVVGVIGLVTRKVYARHLYALYFLISNLSFFWTLVVRNAYHPEHLYNVVLYLWISGYLAWRIGREKMHKRLERLRKQMAEKGE